MKSSYFYRILLTNVVRLAARHPYMILIGGLIYLILPFDFFPEGIVGIFGYFDDFLLLLLCFILLNRLKKPSFTQPSNTNPIEKDPYQILGISPNANDNEIKKAYRQRMTEYHPDKVAHLGDDLKERAKEKTLEIQQAYEALAK